MTSTPHMTFRHREMEIRLTDWNGYAAMVSMRIWMPESAVPCTDPAPIKLPPPAAAARDRQAAGKELYMRLLEVFKQLSKDLPNSLGEDLRKLNGPWRIRLDIDASAQELQELPWEWMELESGDGLLVAMKEYALSRYVATENTRLFVPPNSPPRHFLSLYAPWRGEWLESLQTLLRLRPPAGPQPVKKLGPLGVTEVSKGTLQELENALKQGDEFQSVLYLCCTVSSVNQRPIFLLQSALEEQADLVTVDRLCSKLLASKQPPRLVLLHAQVDKGSIADGVTMASAAQAAHHMVAAGLPAVLVIPGTLEADHSFFELLGKALMACEGTADLALASARCQALQQPNLPAAEQAALKSCVLYSCLRSSKLWLAPLSLAPEIKQRINTSAAAGSNTGETKRPVVFVGPQRGAAERGFWPALVRRWAAQLNYSLSRSPAHELARIARYAELDAAEKLGVLKALLGHWIVEEGMQLPLLDLEQLGITLNEKLKVKHSEYWKKLAALGAGIYYTSDPTDGLFEALKERNPIRIIGGMNRSWGNTAANDPSTLFSKDRPLVVHYLGHLLDPISFVLTEDDYLTLLTTIHERMSSKPVSLTLKNKSSAANRPENPSDSNNKTFLDMVSRSNTDADLVLFLGFELNLEDWEFQIALRGIFNKIEMFRHANCAAVQMTPHEDALWQPEVARAYLHKYLRKHLNNTKTDVYWCDSYEFLGQLTPLHKS